MTAEEWLRWYEDRTGCKDLELSPNEQIFFHPEHGFITFFTHDDVLELHHMCGNGKQWQKLVVEVMKDYGLKKLRAFTRRNPKAWSRKYGGHIRGYYMEADIEELKEADDGKRRNEDPANIEERARTRTTDEFTTRVV